MKLKSFGCSFVYGSDLDPAATAGFRASEHTWPAVLAQRLGWQYQCHARPGIGNLQIFDSVLRELHSDPDSVFVIAWTWIDRHDFHSGGQSQWSTIRPTTESDLARTYYRDLHSQYRDQLQSLIVMSAACDLLRGSGRPFVITAMDDLLWETNWRQNQHFCLLQQQVRHCVTDFQGNNFLTWSQQQGHAISHNLHPLHDAHQAAADFLLEKHQWLQKF